MTINHDPHEPTGSDLTELFNQLEPVRPPSGGTPAIRRRVRERRRRRIAATAIAAIAIVGAGAVSLDATRGSGDTFEVAGNGAPHANPDDDGTTPVAQAPTVTPPSRSTPGQPESAAVSDPGSSPSVTPTATRLGSAAPGVGDVEQASGTPNPVGTPAVGSVPNPTPPPIELSPTPTPLPLGPGAAPTETSLPTSIPPATPPTAPDPSPTPTVGPTVTPIPPPRSTPTPIAPTPTALPPTPTAPPPTVTPMVPTPTPIPPTPTATPTVGIDTDGDGVADSTDNCTTVPNASQFDSNFDSYGNACDADLNNDNIVNFLDQAQFVEALEAGTYVADADFDGDGDVDLDDQQILKEGFLLPPGPAA